MGKSSLISRRNFLKLSSMGFFSLFGPQLSPFKSLLAGQKGRVIFETVNIHQRPSLSSPRQRMYWKDAVIPITEVTIGDQEPSHNRIWYRIGSEGYAHSGGIQPVREDVNPVIYDLPAGGALAEVTVPYTDALWTPGERYHVAYRFYYETTHWVSSVVTGVDGTPYYHILEDKWELDYYVPARHLRLIPASEVSLLSPEIPNYAKKLLVVNELQSVIAYEFSQPVFMIKGATGADFSTGKYTTPTGNFLSNYKRPSRHMAAGNLAMNGYDLPGVPWITYITESGIAFHGTYWHNDFGKARSHGCINLPSKASKWLYRWTLPHVPHTEQWAYDDTATHVQVINKFGS